MSNILDLQNLLLDIDDSNILDLRQIFDDFYSQDIAEAYDNLDKKAKELLFTVLSDDQGAAVLSDLAKSDLRDLLEIVSDDQLVRFVNNMALDDAADIIATIDDKRMLYILENIQRPAELKELMSFEPDTCGGIMAPNFISVREDLKVASALRYIRVKAKESDTEIVYIYVTKKFGELVGVISIKELFLSADEDLVSQHMNREIISVKVDDDQELAADLIAKYRFLAIPVLNNNEQLLGIITVDDAVQVIEEEATEDIYQSSGISEAKQTSSLIKEYFVAYKARTPWLIVTLLGQYLSSILIASYHTTIISIPIAISFMPLLSGLSGNIGNQSSTIIVRGLYTGEVNENKSIKVFLHELVISLCIGLTCALMTGFLSFYFYKNLSLSFLIAMSLILSMMLAVALGTLTPIVFKKFQWDPAAASGPLITTAIDMISFFVYLTMITKFINELI